MLTFSWVATIATAAASDVVSVRACSDTPEPHSVRWAVDRTVRIEVGSGAGTGVVVSPDGFVLTAAHVVAEPGDIAIVFKDGRRFEATVVRSSPDSDLALVHMDGRDFACMPVRPDPAEVGDDVFVIGSPGGELLTHSVSKGIVSAYREMDGRTVVQTDATINAGNSGGPMVGPGGDLIGIVSFKVVGDGVEGLGFAVAATNIPAELGLRWGTQSDADLAATSGEDARAARFLSAQPGVELGPGVELDNNAWYEMSYRPRTKRLVWGSILFTTGLVLVGETVATYNKQEPMTKVSWTLLQLENATGGTLLIGGGALIGLAVAFPSPVGPVVSGGSGGGG